MFDARVKIGAAYAAYAASAAYATSDVYDLILDKNGSTNAYWSGDLYKFPAAAYISDEKRILQCLH